MVDILKQLAEYELPMSADELSEALAMSRYLSALGAVIRNADLPRDPKKSEKARKRFWQELYRKPSRYNPPSL